jgi:hypothetical protein
MTIASTRLQSSRYDNVSAILWPTYGMMGCRVEHHAEESRALCDGCGRRRHMVHPSRHVPQGHPCTLRYPSGAENACQEDP